MILALSSGGGGGRRRVAWGGGAAGAVAQRNLNGDRRDGGGGGVGGRGSRTELPPCPVCIDRLDPAVSGIPFARSGSKSSSSDGGEGGSGGGGITGAILGSCRHRDCNSRGGKAGEASTEAAATAAAAGSAPRPKSGVSDDDSAGHDPVCEKKEASPTGQALGGDKHGDRGPGWEGERTRQGGGSGATPIDALRPGGEERLRGKGREGAGGGGGPALNVTMWKGSNCRVCRSLNVALNGAPGELCCETCRIAHNLWICMVCGHIGCGRYTGEHASRHFRLSSHTYSLELSTGRVWDYIGDCYAHRALRGHLAPSHDRAGRHGHGQRGDGARWGRDSSGGARGAEGGAAGGGGGGRGEGGRDGSPPMYSEARPNAYGGFDDHRDASSLKMAVVSREYEALVARQLQEQQRYFEDLIATAVAVDAEANAPVEEVLTDEERAEVGRLREAIDELSGKYEGILDSLRTDEETARRVRSENRGLVSEQRSQKREEGRLAEEARQTRRQCEQQMSELEGQMQDLLFFLKTQEKVKSSPRRQEIVGGSVVMEEGSAGAAGGGNGRGGAKETERERLARRLKERSHSRRAGSTGAKPNR
ncbi:unnamed protein product [Ectocarpus sp. 12 AP-2014]